MAVVLWEGTDGRLVLACPACDNDIRVRAVPRSGDSWSCWLCGAGGILVG